MKVEKIISGGQTGADRGGLDAAIACGVPHGGWCPRGRLAEDGVIPQCYQLHETASADYAERTTANVLEADATIVFSHGPLTGGSLLTAESARAAGKPCLHVDLSDIKPEKACCKIKQWLHSVSRLKVLNIAGTRESEETGIADEVKQTVLLLLQPSTIGEKADRLPQ